MLKYIILGSGFRSCIAALLASKKGHDVLLIDSGDTICKFIKPVEVNGFLLDKGPQFFDDFSLNDWNLMNKLLGKELFHDLEFKYASYYNGKVNTDFAIPAWDANNSFNTDDIFEDLRSIKKNNIDNFENFDELLKYDGGKYLYSHLKKLCQKMLQINPEDASQTLNNLVTFTGRKKLFDQEKSMKLKEDEFYDQILAAKKKYVGEPRYNLYPKSGNLEDVRLAIEDALISNNVEIILNQEIKSIDLKKNKVILPDSRSIDFDKIVFADNIQKTEIDFKKSNKISEKTFYLPQVLYFMEVDKKQLPEFNYVMNYELSHISSRFTNFGNYLSPFNKDTGIICAEVPTKIDSEIWKNKDDYVSKVTTELNEVYNKDINVLSTISVPIKSTYKIPLVGYEKEVNNLIKELKSKNYNNNVIVPDPFILTRKQAIDSIMPYFA